MTQWVKVLAAQACGPEFDPEDPCKKSHVAQAGLKLDIKPRKTLNF